MKLGTKSLLFGCHQFVLHPLFILVAWWRLYGRPSWRMIIAIVIHDWGYWGCPSMDGPEGELHPVGPASWLWKQGWVDEGREVLYHSRYLSRRYDEKPSRLCWADKLGTAMYPVWLWVLLARLSGEVKEYMDDTKYEIHDSDGWGKGKPSEFFRRYKAKVAEWMKETGNED